MDSRPPKLPASGPPPPLAMNKPPPLPDERGPSRLAPAKLERPRKRASVLTLKELSRYHNLLVFARSRVEGYFSGKHKSTKRGGAGEFTDYKQYVPGDDIGNIDWKVYGRTRRLYLRRYTEETDMTVYVLVDVSASMAYRGERRQPKSFLAAKIAAALSYLMIRQGDQTGLGLFDETLKSFIPPGSSQRKLHEIVRTLEEIEPSSRTGLANALRQAEAVFRQRGRLVIISDFLDQPQEIFDTLGRFLHRRFEILLMQVLDPDERELPAHAAAQYVDMETGARMRVDPLELRAAYREQMAGFIRRLERDAVNRRIDHCLIDSSFPYTQAIEAYLGFRNGRPIR
ncbi:DUF58 domain-containing protein [Ruficoccus amylovorans]|uniref:DUF58 domain-containing protein n=1 Tax=Ruficoccus amylovorans TaxID=1804625 RepID=A0A842HE56_9BACT|nr:DUF58 domain-containing protein [Ruficoccus amylovorans]MBC2593946.1 DUF58 domain-containing protein [Ruficoccus amylovorans]